MNRATPSLLLLLWQNESCETIGMKIYVTFILIHIKIKSFSCKTFSTSTRSEKEANGNSEVEVKSAYVQSGLLGQVYSSFCNMKRQGVFLMPPGWDASPSQVYSQTLTLPVLIYAPEWILRHYESKVSHPKTQYNADCSEPELEPILLEIEKKYKNQITGYLHRQLITLKWIISNFDWNWNIVFKLTCT